MRVERYQQLIFVVALGLSGIVLGQVLRRVRHVAEDHAARCLSSPATAQRETS
ncbi:MAG TPA: hypothetical protein VNH11_15810 [Pirellulales bacterium]|nr:hypothetical protein [Pirellulales bacterium]